MEKSIFLSELKLNARKVESLPTKLLPNWVLIKPEVIHEQEKSGIKLLADPDFTSNTGGEEINMSDHAPRYGEVVAICDQLFFDKKLLGTENTSASLEWDAEMEVKVGDNVFFSYLKGALGEHIIYDDELYYLIRYDALYALKFDSPKPINGWILFEPIEKESLSNIVIDPNLIMKYKAQMGIVRHIGKPNKDYSYDENLDYIDVEEGDVCLFDNPYVGSQRLFLESKDKYFRVYDKRYFLFQRRDIGLVYEKS